MKVKQKLSPRRAEDTEEVIDDGQAPLPLYKQNHKEHTGTIRRRIVKAKNSNNYREKQKAEIKALRSLLVQVEQEIGQKMAEKEQEMAEKEQKMAAQMAELRQENVSLARLVTSLAMRLEAQILRNKSTDFFGEAPMEISEMLDTFEEIDMDKDILDPLSIDNKDPHPSHNATVKQQYTRTSLDEASLPIVKGWLTTPVVNTAHTGIAKPKQHGYLEEHQHYDIPWDEELSLDGDDGFEHRRNAPLNEIVPAQEYEKKHLGNLCDKLLKKD